MGLGDRSTMNRSTGGKTVKRNTQALVNYQVGEHTLRVEGRGIGYSYWQVGQTVEVLYDAQNPERARIKRWDELYLFTALSGVMMLACWLFGLVFLLVNTVRKRFGSKASKPTANLAV